VSTGLVRSGSISSRIR